MSTQKLKRFRFSTDAQWNACLFVQADRDLRRHGGGIRPFAPYARPGIPYESGHSHAPALTGAGEILWRDNNGAIWRLTKCDNEPESFMAPIAIASTSRMVATSSGLWIFGDPPESLQLYEEDSLTRLLTVDVPGAPVVDIANGGQGCVLALVQREGVWQSVRLDRFGREVETIKFKGILDARKFAFLRRSQKLVVLAGEYQPRLYWFSAENGFELFSLTVAAMRPCFKAHTLGSDSNDRVFLAGTEGDEIGGPAYVMIFDADGNVLGELPLESQDAPATGIAAGRDSLLVTGNRGLVKFNVAELVPEGAGRVQCTLITPSLFSPDREDRRRWLRIEAMASLPDGCTLEISWAATDDAAARDRLTEIASDDSILASQRVARLLNEPELRRGRTEFHGAAGSDTQIEKKKFSAKLFDVNERYLWVGITLSAASGARLPLLTELAVIYPGRTLMEDLPAIYQKEEERSGSFLRALVGVLETSTQELDVRISSLGRLVHPTTAPADWLDFLARWLGVPWDDSLTERQKRAIVKRAPELAKLRGTRAGLEALLDCLMPGLPRRFRVTDATADFGFAVVGGQSCAGSALPAILGGSTRWKPELDSSAVLGFMRLPCPEQFEDGVWQLGGKIRIDVAATAQERREWEPWLLALITEMVPLLARVELRWVASQALRTNRLDGTMTLQSAPMPHLDTDAITGLARLPERGTLVSRAGPIVGTRLG